eukprot:6214326-Pleurochrysis_carterae.AAC.2
MSSLSTERVAVTASRRNVRFRSKTVFLDDIRRLHDLAQNVQRETSAVPSVDGGSEAHGNGKMH